VAPNKCEVSKIKGDNMQDIEDVTKLTDEELDARIAGQPEPEQEETTDVVAAPAEEPEKDSEEERVEDKAEPAEEPVEEPEADKPKEEEPKPPSRREQMRIRDILARMGEKPHQPAPSQEAPQQRQQLDYSQALDADPEVIKQLEDDRNQAVEYSRNQGLLESQRMSDTRIVSSEFRTNVKVDYPLVKDKLDKLDPDSRQELDVEYMQYHGYNYETGQLNNPYINTIGYADFVNARIEQSERIASRMAEQTTKNVTKQAAQTGLRPDGSSAKSLNLNKAPAQMSDEELDAYLKKSGYGT